MPLSRFEMMLKTDSIFFFDTTEFEGIIQYYLDIGKHSLARKALELGMEQHPSSIILKLLKVELLTFEDDINKAVELLSEIEAVEPHNDEVIFQKAAIFSKTNQHEEAIQVLQMSLEYVEDPTDIWALLGMEYMYIDDYKNARQSFKNCLQNDVEDYQSLHNIIYCFEIDEQFNEAISFLIEFLDKNPYCEIAWHQLGKQYFTLNNYEKALEAFDYSVIIDEGFIGGYLEKAKTLEGLNRYEEAVENYLITLELDDPTAFAYIRIGECFEKLGAKETAISYYEKAVHEDPLLDKGWLLLTDIYHNDGNYKEALHFINKALYIDDTNPLYWRKLAFVNLKLNLYKEASKAFYTCVHLGDVAIEVFIALADLLLFLGDHEDALGVLVKSKKIYNSLAEIEYRLAGLFLLLNQYENGLVHLKNGLAIDYDSHNIIKPLFPSVFDSIEVCNVINEFKV